MWEASFGAEKGELFIDTVLLWPELVSALWAFDKDADKVELPLLLLLGFLGTCKYALLPKLFKLLRLELLLELYFSSDDCAF